MHCISKSVVHFILIKIDLNIADFSQLASTRRKTLLFELKRHELNPKKYVIQK